MGARKAGAQTFWIMKAPAGVQGQISRDYRRHWTPVHLDFTVDDIDAAVRRAVDAGGKLEGEVQRGAKGALANLVGPVRQRSGFGLRPEVVNLPDHDIARSAEGESRVNAIEAKARLSSMLRRWPPQLILLVTFACFYFAIGPGNFFAVDEVMEEETAQALILRHSIDIPVMVDARFGRGRNWYTVKGPGLPMVSLPFVYLGLKLDDAIRIDERWPACGSSYWAELSSRCAGADGSQSRPR